jgi:DNA-binding GntR family transcriptional regulator
VLVVKQESKVTFVHRALRRAILEQAIEPGTKLPEDTIGEQFGVSRTIVRRALERLAAEELVEILPNRGASVIRPTLEDAHNLFELRMELEDIVVRRLSGRLGAEAVSRLGASVAAEQAAYAAHRPEYIRLSAEFHLILAEMCGNPLLERHLRQLIWRSAIVMRLHGRPNWESCSMDEHHALIEALAGQDTEHCRRLMAHHLDHLLRRALGGDKMPADPSLKEILGHYTND